MNQNQSQRAPKVEITGRPVRAQAGYNQQQQQQQSPPNQQRLSRVKPAAIEEVPVAQLLESSSRGQTRFDEEKLPLFLIKLWNIVEDVNMQSIVHWDESGASFHISDPYSFGRNILPHYFKHNNMNSLIRQLNMYGFRKMTPLNQGGLTRSESDQDHLEFSHPYFVQNHPELLVHIKRKQSGRQTEDKQVSMQTQHNVEMVMTEVRAMREKMRNMENRMNSVTKENRQLWDQMTTMRQQHTRQQHVVHKLFHFLVSIVQPGLSKRVSKRNGVLAIDDFGPTNAKRARNDSANAQPAQPGGAAGGNLLNTGNLYEMLESLQRELSDGGSFRRFANDRGPVIADVTEEMGHSPNGSSRHNSFGTTEPFNTNPGGTYSDHSGNVSPVPIVSPASSGTMKLQQPSSSSYEYPTTSPTVPYMGSGALSMEDVMRKNKNPPETDFNINRKQPKRSSYRGQYSPTTSSVTTYQPPAQTETRHVVPQYPNQLAYNYNDSVAPIEQPQQQTQQQPQQQGQLVRSDVQQGNLNSLSFDDRDIATPTLIMSPSMERQLSQEMQEYLNNVDFSIDNCRDLLTTTDWDTFGGDLDDNEFGEGPSGSGGGGGGSRQQLALENSPFEEYGTFAENRNQGIPSINSSTRNNLNLNDSADNLDFDTFDVNFPPMREPTVDGIYPRTPELLTPGSSPSRL